MDGLTPTFPGRCISVVGCPGSGKTTLSRRLARRLGYRHVELDALYHQPGWRPLPTDRFRAAVANALESDGWVVEGNYSVVRPLILERSDTVIWLDLPRHQAMGQLLWRTLVRTLGRQVLWNGNREPWSNLYSLAPERSILAWAWTRHGEYRRRYGEEMKAAPPGVTSASNPGVPRTTCWPGSANPSGVTPPCLPRHGFASRGLAHCAPPSRSGKPSMHDEDDEALAEQALMEAIENQVEADDPPAARATLNKLTLVGYAREESLHLMALVLAQAIRTMLRDDQPFDLAWYEQSLRALPELPEDDGEPDA